MTHDNNPIAEFFTDLQSRFEDFYLQDEKSICHIAGDRQEHRLVQGLQQYENTEHKKFDGFFLRFSVPFDSPETYTNACLEELHYIVGQAREQYFTPEEKVLNLDLPAKIQNAEELYVLVHKLAVAFEQFTLDTVVFFDPMQIADDELFENWLINAHADGLPAQCKCIVFSDKENYIMERLNEDLTIVWEIDCDYDFGQAVQDIASDGDPKDPAVQFRSLFTKMTIAAQHHSWEKAMQYGEEALAIAEQQTDWEHLEVSIWLAIAGFKINTKNIDEALELYDKAVNMAESLQKAKPEIGNALLNQAYTARASASVLQSEFETAAEDYELNASWIGEDKTFALEKMESLRMLGFCLKRAGNNDGAMQAYQTALKTAEEADPQAYPHSTLPYIGKAILDIAHAWGNQDMVRETEDKMVQLMGEDWDQNLTKEERKAI